MYEIKCENACNDNEVRQKKLNFQMWANSKNIVLVLLLFASVYKLYQECIVLTNNYAVCVLCKLECLQLDCCILLQALEIFCNDIQGSITGALVFTFPNGHLYCTALLKATCCFVPPLSFSSTINAATTSSHLAQHTSTSTSSPPTTHIKPSTPGSGSLGSDSVRATRTHGEPSSTGSGHSATMTNTATPQRRPTAGSACLSDGAVSPPPTSSSGTANLDTGAAVGASSSLRSQTPSKVGGSRHGSSASGQWKTGGGGGGGGTGAASAFRPPQSQGIPITAGSSSRCGVLRRQSSKRTNSFGGGSMGAAGVLSSPFSGPGSFLRSAAIFSSQHSSLNSWSVWNSESFDSRFGRENHLLRWGGDGAPSSASHSLRSWVWVRDPCESDLSGTCKSVCLHAIVSTKTVFQHYFYVLNYACLLVSLTILIENFIVQCLSIWCYSSSYVHVHAYNNIIIRCTVAVHGSVFHWTCLISWDNMIYMYT